MQLNITTDYAIRIMIYLSEKQDIASSKEISEAVKISQNYSMRILRQLAKAGLLNMVRGTNGGYIAAKPADQISLYDIIVEMEPTIRINQCLDDVANCSLKATGYCPVHKFYLSLQEDLENKLKSMTIDKIKNYGNDDLIFD